MLDAVEETNLTEENLVYCCSCNTKLLGDFCYSCGEKKFDKQELSLKHFIKGIFQESTDLDSTFFRTFIALLFKPGQLTKEYVSGKKTLYIKPLKLYVMIVAVSLIIYSNFEPLAFNDIRTFMKYDTSGATTKALTQLAMDARLDFKTFIEKFNENLKNYNTFLGYIELIFFALILKLFYLKSNKYYAEHLIFSVHFYSFIFLGFIFVSPLVFISSSLLNIIFYLLLIVYLAFSIKQVYVETKLKTILKTFGLMIACFSLSMVSLIISVALSTMMLLRSAAEAAK